MLSPPVYLPETLPTGEESVRKDGLAPVLESRRKEAVGADRVENVPSRVAVPFPQVQAVDRQQFCVP